MVENYNQTLSQENIDKVYETAKKIHHAKGRHHRTTLTYDEMTQFAHEVASQLTFMVHINTVRRYLECVYPTLIPQPQNP